MSKVKRQIFRYEPDADVLSWEVSHQPIDSAREIGNLIVHFSKDQTPVLVEVLEARSFLRRLRRLARPVKKSIDRKFRLRQTD